MRLALQKSPIPSTHLLLVKHLKEDLFDPNWHFHSEYQIFIVLKGRGTRFIGDNVQPFKEGDITFTGPNLPHLWQSDTGEKKGERAEGIVVYFQGDFLEQNFMQKQEAVLLRQLLKRSLRGLRADGETAKIVGEMLLEIPEKEDFESLLQLLKILNCLAHSKDLESLASPGYTNTQKEGDTRRMNKVYAHVMKHFKGRVSVSELADMTNMTPTSFSRYFKNHANKTFSEFLSEIRIGHACKLLIDEKANASRACYESGFNTLSNFNRQFKAITRRTPMEYKREYLMR